LVRYSIGAVGASGLGSIEVGEKDTVVSLPERTHRFLTRYVTGVELGDKMALGKIKVHLTYYDLLGTREELELVMNENDSKALKKALGK